MVLETLEQRLAKVLAGGATPLQDEVLAPLIRASPLLFAQLCLEGPPQAPFNRRLLFSPAHMAWETLMTTAKRYVLVASRGSGKSFITTYLLTLWRCATQPNCSGYIFSGTEFAAQRMLEEIKMEIERNPKLQWLYPGHQSRKWTATQFRTSNGHHVTAKGMMTRVRGAHPDTIILDDALTDEDAWSYSKRTKTIDYFFSTITNMILPGGQIGVVGCVSPDTLVNSATLGLVPIGDLAPDEAKVSSFRRPNLYPFRHQIVGKNGVRQTSHFWCNGNSANRGIILKNGQEITASLRHPMWCMDAATGVGHWKKCSELTVGDYIAIRPGAETYGPNIDIRPMHKGILQSEKCRGGRMVNYMDLPDVMTADLGYLIGLWISEGTRCPKGRVSISNTEAYIRDFLSNAPFGIKFKQGCSEDTAHTMRASCQHFYRLLNYLGLDSLEKAPKKSIPKRLMSAPEEVVVGLLQGIYDGDGCCPQGKELIHLATTSPVLARQVQDLLLNMGIVSFKQQEQRVKQASKRAVAKHRVWTLVCYSDDAYLFSRKVGFRLPRKQRIAFKIRQKAKGRAIPHQQSVLNEMLREWGMRKVQDRFPLGGQGKLSGHETLADIQKRCGINFSVLRSVNLAVYAASMQRVVNALGMADDPCDSSRNAQKNIDDNFAWVPVREILKRYGATCDFVVPKDHSFLANGMVCHNTPMARQDLLDNLQQNPSYQAGVFPALDKNEQSTWPEVYTTEYLMGIRREIGSVRFARERQCTPVSDESSIFPKALFFQGDTMQPQARLGSPLEYWRSMGIEDVYIGVDFAFSASVSADYFAIFVCGVDGHQNRWLLDMHRERGVSFSAQKAHIVSFGRRYDPRIIHLESNAAQQVAADEIKRETDLPIRKFVTTAKRHSLEDGLPSLRILLENNKVRLPRGDARSVEVTDILIEEANNFTWVGGQAKSVGGHDDTVLAWFICEQAVRRGLRSSRLMTGSGLSSAPGSTLPNVSEPLSQPNRVQTPQRPQTGPSFPNLPTLPPAGIKKQHPGLMATGRGNQPQGNPGPQMQTVMRNGVYVRVEMP